MYIVNKEIGKRIKECRKKEGMFQKELADKINYSEDYIGRIERGELIPTLRALSGFKNACNWDIDYILTGLHTPESPFDDLYNNCNHRQRYELTDCILWVIRNSDIFNYLNIEELNITLNIIKYVNELNRNRSKTIYTNYSKEMKMIFEENEAPAELIYDNTVLYGLRKSVEKSQGFMAKKYGVRQKRYLEVEKGKSVPDLQMINDMYSYFGVNPNYLISGKIEEMVSMTYIWNNWSKEIQEKLYSRIMMGYNYMMGNEKYF